jgi:hypothetical protein
MLVHATLSIFYSVNTPLWESYDETGHYSYAHYIATHGALPPPGTMLARYNETHQPPLYYALVALPISLIDTSDDAQPRFALGGGVYVVPDERIDAFPYRGTALALRLGRMVSVLFSTLAVAFTYLTARIALPRQMDVALLATALYALWPLTLFMGGTITNDIGMAFFGALTLLFAVRLWAKPAGQPRHADYVGLALSLAGAVMTKDSAVALVLFGGVMAAALVVREAMRGHGTPRKLLSSLAELAFLVLPLAALIAAGAVLSDGRSLRQFAQTTSFASNLVPTAGVPSLSPANVGRLSTGDRLRFFIDGCFSFLWRLAFETMFGTFGWGLLRMPARWYDLAIVGTLFATAGLVWGMLKARARWVPLLMMVMLGCVALAPVVRTVTTANLSLLNGRFFLPALSALTILLALGLLTFPRLVARAGATFVLAGISLVAVVSPWLVIRPFYRKPDMLDALASPAGMQTPLALTYGDSIQVLGYSLPGAKAWRGDYAGMTLYWRALRPMSKDYGLRVENFSVDGQSFQNGLNYTPGNSVYPTSFWKPGDTFSETYYLPIGPDAPAPTLATFKVTWFDQEEDDLLRQALTPVCPDGQPCEPKFGSLPVGLDSGSVTQWASTPALNRLGERIELLDAQSPATAQAGQTLTFTLTWRAKAAGLPALTTFIHVLSADGKLVAQVDCPPRAGTYPTEVWTKGEVIPDTHTLRLDPGLPAGVYQVRLGMYDSKTVERLPAFDAAGKALRDNAIPLPDMTIQ